MFKIYSRYGVVIAVVVIAYFLLLKLLGLHQYPVLSAANGVVYGAGILLAIKKYKATSTKFQYEKGFVEFCGYFKPSILTAFDYWGLV